ncbi:tetratricopeptide repeat protein [Teredinibacter turnerae]|uniref:tetratricopeptide repeat protein n=1 Tax=Teredinibacter turnerae TaxID=2426 RepID=UPI000372121B|nr:tetratricopeptide repeat protein [Teredinibacter turnerae]
MKPYRLIALAVAVHTLAGCAWLGLGEPNYGKTLADMSEAEIPSDPMPVEPTTMDQIEDSYRAALDVATDPAVRHQILVRLADLEMKRSEQEQLDAQTQKEFFGDAVSMYEELIKLNQERPINGELMSNERLLYRLSKAYALDGRMAASDAVLAELVESYPESAYAAEAEFRRAEQAFTYGDYEQAEKLYQQVVDAGENTPFYENAVYMHGWSEFKRGNNRAAIESFTVVLDRKLANADANLADLSSSDRNMVGDTLRVMGIVFSYLDGAEAITGIYNDLGQRHYQHLLYMQLGELYLEKKRFRDSADTFSHYIKTFPQTDYAPLFAVRAIDVLMKGNFPSEILPAKEQYVKDYGVYSSYWQSRSDDQRKMLLPQLHTYLEELSSYYHASAQDLKKQVARYQAAKANGKKPGFELPDETPQTYFLLAAGYYEQFLATFPGDEKTGEMTYLMAEANYEAGQLRPAIVAYEKVAYDLLDKEHGGEAGYAALIAMQELIDGFTITSEADKTQLAEWRTHKINSSISFADYYPEDRRAAPVLTKAAQDVFQQGDLPRAVSIATRMTQWQPAPPASLQKTAWLVLGHSQFDLGNFNEADAAYRQVLTLLPEEDPERESVTERLAASMYKSSEQQIAAGDKMPAVAKMLQIASVAPGTTIAIKARYDAANLLMDMKNWSEAERVLLDFRTRYPEHELTATLPPKLAMIYQETEQWDKAAQQLAVMAKSGDPEVMRQSLYLSAELFEKSGDKARALEQYRSYANQYPAPFDIATEARFKLVSLYGESGDSSKRYYWLKELVKADKAAGSTRTDRSRYLAAMATAEFAEDDYNRFNSIKLTLPIKKSLRKKKAAMDQTLKSYRAVLDYGVAEFTTEANYRIGMLYAQLSRDLMDSQRPPGLDLLAMEQYEILLEEQAYPFEEKAIDIHANNAQRAWEGLYDDGVKHSFDALAKLLPARYGKTEVQGEVSRGLH